MSLGKHSFLPTIVLGLAFILLVVSSLLFVNSPTNFYSLPFGDYQVGSYYQGISIFLNQQKNQIFYSLSPYNDYYLDELGISHRYWLGHSNQPEIKYLPTKTELWWQTLTHYFGFPSFDYFFHNEVLTMKYQVTRTNSQCVHLTKTVTLTGEQHWQKIGTTIATTANDFVFNPYDLQLMSVNDSDDLEVLTNVYGDEFLAVPTYRDTLESLNRQIAWTNLDGVGFLIVQVDQNSRLLYNQNTRLISIETPLDNLLSIPAVEFDVCYVDNLLNWEENLP